MSPKWAKYWSFSSINNTGNIAPKLIQTYESIRKIYPNRNTRHKKVF